MNSKVKKVMKSFKHLSICLTRQAHDAWATKTSTQQLWAIDLLAYKMNNTLHALLKNTLQDLFDSQSKVYVRKGNRSASREPLDLVTKAVKNEAMPQAAGETKPKTGGVRGGPAGWGGSGLWWTVWLFSPGGVDLWKGTVCCVCCCTVSVITLNHTAINHPHATAAAGTAALAVARPCRIMPRVDQVRRTERSEWLVRHQRCTDFRSLLERQQSTAVCVCRCIQTVVQTECVYPNQRRDQGLCYYCKPDVDRRHVSPVHFALSLAP